MYIIVESVRSTHNQPSVEVVPGFVSRLQFQFSAHHQEGDEVIYELSGVYEIIVSVEAPQKGRIFVGYGHLGDPSTWLQQIFSRRKGRRSWTVSVEMPHSVINEIDSGRDRSLDIPIEFTFEWYMPFRNLSITPQQGEPTWFIDRPVYGESGGGLSIPVRVPIMAQQWAKLMEAYGYPQSRYIQLKFNPVNKQQWAKAADLMLTADQHYDRREDQAAMLACEHALQQVFTEQIIKMPAGPNKTTKIKEQFIAWGFPDEPKTVWLADCVAFVMVYCRQEKHNLTGADAQLALLTTKSVLGFLSQSISA